MLSTNHDRERHEDPRRYPIGGRAGRRGCRRDGEPHDGPDRRARHHLYLDGDGRARAARQIFSAAGAVAAELFSCGCRHSDRGRQQPAGSRRPPPVAASHRLGIAQKDALLDFWYHGDTWTQPEVNDFIQKLQRV